MPFNTRYKRQLPIHFQDESEAAYLIMISVDLITVLVCVRRVGARRQLSIEADR